jgi:CTP:molybdopterin cytidylyltransferase MocA
VILGLIPAGGRSTRMGRPKLALPLAGRAVIEHVVTALRGGGADAVLVVVGPHAPEVGPLAAAAGAEVLALPEPAADMRATVEHGLRWLAAHYQPRQEDAWLLAPGDCAGLTAESVRAVCEGRARHPEAPVVVPVCGGRRGHPVLLAWPLVAEVARLPPGAGVDYLVKSRAAATVEVSAGPGVLSDLDTPAEYENLLRPVPPT